MRVGSVTLIRGSAVRLMLRARIGRRKARKSTKRSKGKDVGKLEVLGGYGELRGLGGSQTPRVQWSWRSKGLIKGVRIEVSLRGCWGETHVRLASTSIKDQEAFLKKRDFWTI